MRRPTLCGLLTGTDTVHTKVFQEKCYSNFLRERMTSLQTSKLLLKADKTTLPCTTGTSKTFRSFQAYLTPELASATLDYFVSCGDRLSQMTKTYHDIDAVTRLLQEKEKDLELAAKIGQVSNTICQLLKIRLTRNCRH